MAQKRSAKPTKPQAAAPEAPEARKGRLSQTDVNRMVAEVQAKGHTIVSVDERSAAERLATVRRSLGILRKRQTDDPSNRATPGLIRFHEKMEQELIPAAQKEAAAAKLATVDDARLRQLCVEFDVSTEGERSALIERIAQASADYGVDVTDDWSTK